MNDQNCYVQLADVMIDRIIDVVNQNLKSIVRIESAIVESVNTNGTVNIYFPPDNQNVFTNIQNQSTFNLSPGDAVEVILKDGSYTNCWIIAKHGVTNLSSGSGEIKTYNINSNNKSASLYDGASFEFYGTDLIIKTK